MGAGGFEAFWAELRPCAHIVEIYQSEGEFLENLAEFVAGGLANGEAAILIATPAHRDAVVSRLTSLHFDIAAFSARDQLILLDAEDVISRFVINDWPDEALFQREIGAVLQRAVARGRKVRAFGEMVALMWANGLCGATIQLEHLWTDLCRRLEFSLYCAYPKAGFTVDAMTDIARVRDLHSAATG